MIREGSSANFFASDSSSYPEGGRTEKSNDGRLTAKSGNGQTAKTEGRKRKISEHHAGESFCENITPSPDLDYDSNSDSYPPDPYYIDPDHLTDEQILDWCDSEEDKPEDLEVLKTVRKYLKQIKASQGFDIIDYPGMISGVTPIRPSDFIITKWECYPEAFATVKSLATKAIEKYNRHNPETQFEVMEIEKLNMSRSRVDVHYITFSARNVKAGEAYPTAAIETFQAQVANDRIDKRQNVYFCRRKPE